MFPSGDETILVYRMTGGRNKPVGEGLDKTSFRGRSLVRSRDTHT